MKVLIYGNRKQDDAIYDISTPEKEAAAFLAVFKTLDEDWQVYESSDLNAADKKLYDAAKAGDAAAAKRLMSRRKDYEYEEWHYGEVIDPLAPEAA